MSIRKEFNIARSRVNVKRRLKAIYEKSRAALQAEFDKSGDELVALQKRYVPKDQGDLDRSIKKRPLRSGKIGVEVVAGNGTDAFHARFVEHGTQNMEAQPYFFPPYRILRPRFKRRHRRAQKKAIKQALK